MNNYYLLISRYPFLFFSVLLLSAILGMKPCAADGLKSESANAPASIAADIHHEIIVSVKDQKMVLLTDGKVAALYPVSTSKFGIGDRQGSYTTPLGRLIVKVRIGIGQPLGTVFKSRSPTGEVLAPNAPGRDPIVTRILWLEGQEDGNRNAFHRGIYIHGTPQESLLGRPASYGCIRMRSADVAALCDHIANGAKVWIIADHLPIHESLWDRFLDANRFITTQSTSPKPFGKQQT